MTHFLAHHGDTIAFVIVALFAAVVSLWSLSAWLEEQRDAAEAEAQRLDDLTRQDFDDSETPLYDQLAADILHAELDDEATVDAWLRGGAA